MSDERNVLGLDKRLEGILEGRVVVITGAGSGLGKALSFAFAFAGARIGLLGINEKSVKEVAGRINKEFSNCAFPMIASVTNFEQLQKAYDELFEKTGRLDSLINCAGTAETGSIEELNPKAVKLSNELNINGYFYNASIASKLMIPKKNGVIINISSASARLASENTSLYHTAKEAQCMMVREWAMDLGKHNIRANAILCGELFGDERAGIESKIWSKEYFEKKAIDKGLVKKDDKRIGWEKLNPEIKKMVMEYYCKRTALKKQLTYKDVASLAILLCSDFCSKISGESISITSGNPAAFSK